MAGRKPSPLGSDVQHKVSLVFKAADFGVTEQEREDCLAGLALQAVHDRPDFPGWVGNKVEDALAAAAAAGQELREAQEAVDAEEARQAHLEGLAKVYGLSPKKVRAALESACEIVSGAKAKKN